MCGSERLLRLTSDVNTPIKRARLELVREIRHPLETYQICGEIVGSVYNRDVARSTVPDIDKLLGSVSLPLRTKLYIGGGLSKRKVLHEMITYNEDILCITSFTSVELECLAFQEAGDHRRVLQ